MVYARKLLSMYTSIKVSFRNLTYAIVAVAVWDQEHEGPPQTNQLDQFHPVLDWKAPVSCYHLLSKWKKLISKALKWIDPEISMYFPTWITTIVPTAVATCAALGVGGSPNGVILQRKSIKALWNYWVKDVCVIKRHKTDTNYSWLICDCWSRLT